MWAPLLARDGAHPDLPRRRRQVRLRRPGSVDARVAPPVLRQRAPAAQLHRLRRHRRRQPGHPARRHAEGRLPGGRHLPARPRAAVARARPVAADGALRADLVAGLVAERDRRRAPRGARPDAGQRDHEAARSVARPARALLGRRRLGGAAAAAARAGPGRARARPRHLAVPRRGRRDDHRPQFGRIRVPAPRSPAGPHPPAAADRARQRPSRLRRAAGLGVAFGRRPGRRPSPPSSGRLRIPASRAPSAGALPPICSTGRAAPPHDRCASCTRPSNWRPPLRSRPRRAGPRSRSRSHGNSQRSHAGVQRRGLHRRGD